MLRNVRSVVSILTLPMRNWNIAYISLITCRISYFDSTYEELKRSTSALCMQRGEILTLPMRNWNAYTDVILARSPIYFDSTYEELKPHFQLLFFIFSYKILTLPMRNWNIIVIFSSFGRLAPFWLYLWGIETVDRHSDKERHNEFWLYLWGIET